MIASSLANLGFRVAVLYSKGLFEKINVPHNLNYDVIWVPFVALKPTMSAPLRFLNPHFFLKIAQRHCDSETIVHSQGEESAFFKNLNCKKWIHTNRFPDFPNFLAEFDLKTQSPSKKLWLRGPKYANVQLCLQNADLVTTTSKHNQNRVKRLFGVDSQVVPNGIDPVFLEAQWPADQSCKGVFYYGRMVSDKGVDTLIEAYLKLPTHLKNQHPLTLVGQGVELASLKQLAMGSPHIQFIPWANSHEIVKHLQQNRLCALPSRDESFGNTMLEALATGIPLITCAAGSIPEVIGNHGTQIPIGNVQLLKEAMELELTTQPTLNQEQINYVKDNYSWQATVDLFQTLYLEES